MRAQVCGQLQEMGIVVPCTIYRKTSPRKALVERFAVTRLNWNLASVLIWKIEPAWNPVCGFIISCSLRAVRESYPKGPGV
jgi:hypothetical protein